MEGATLVTRGAIVFVFATLSDLIDACSQVKFLKDRIQHIPVRLVFESALELMSSTSIGEFSMAQV